ncbi:MAG TPA: carbohydrate kinase family protein, partial [Pyrinomonadaceae bacterium]
LLPLIDIMIGSKEFPHRVTGIADERRALVEMHARFGCAIVGMTMGAAGAVVYCDGEFIESPGYVAPGGCRDTTGAGDAFHGGFLYGFLTGEDLETSLQFANAVAAMKCSALGARTALPTKSALQSFLNDPC